MNQTAILTPRGGTLADMPVYGPGRDSERPPMPGPAIAQGTPRPPASGPAGGTADGKVKCLNYAACGHWVAATGKTGLCKPCFGASDWPRRNATAKRGNGELRKREPEEQAAFLRRMFRAAVRRAAAEDPGRAMPLLLEFEAELADRINDLGVELYRRDGPSRVAADLTMSGWPMRKQIAGKRWGPSSPAYLARYPEDSAEGMNGEVRDG